MREKVKNIKGNLTNITNGKEYEVVGETKLSYVLINDMGSQMAYDKASFEKVEIVEVVKVVEVEQVVEVEEKVETPKKYKKRK